MKKQSVSRLACVLGIAATTFALSAAHAATVVIAPTVPAGDYQDGFIYSGAPTTPQSGINSAPVRSYYTTDFLVDFKNLVVTPGQTVTSATFQFQFYFEAVTGTGPASFILNQMTTTWDNGVTWNDRGNGLGAWASSVPGGPVAGTDYNTTTLASLSLVPTITNYSLITMDVTSLVNGWVNGSVANDGLILRIVASNVTSAGYYGDYIMSSNKAVTWGTQYIVPTLTYTYSPVPEPSTWALLGLGVVAILCIRRKTKLA